MMYNRFKSAEEIQVEVLIFSRRSRLWLLLLWLFLLLRLLLLLDLLLLFLGRGSACRSTNRNLRKSLADDLNNIAKYILDFSVVERLEDSIDLSLIDWLAGGLEDGNH